MSAMNYCVVRKPDALQMFFVFRGCFNPAQAYFSNVTRAVDFNPSRRVGLRLSCLSLFV